MLQKIVRLFIALIFLVGGLSLGYTVRGISWLVSAPLFLQVALVILPGFVFALLGFSLAPLDNQKIYAVGRLDRKEITEDAIK